jgi:catechol 2,3-dioxygenase-like lactoylglutathione lyase family enzyme
VITGVHAVIFTTEAEETREFFADVLGFSSVDAGGGWLIFALPPAELAAHPTEAGGHHELHLMCDDLHATIAELKARAELKGRGIELAGPISEEPFGLQTALRLPGGVELGLYEPRHPSPLSS